MKESERLTSAGLSADDAALVVAGAAHSLVGLVRHGEQMWGQRTLHPQVRVPSFLLKHTMHIVYIFISPNNVGLKFFLVQEGSIISSWTNERFCCQGHCFNRFCLSVLIFSEQPGQPPISQIWIIIILTFLHC